MTNVIVDSNIFINVWSRETDPRTGLELWKASAEVISASRDGRVRGHVSIMSVFEIIHFVRAKASAAGRDPQDAMYQALAKIEDFNFKRIVPEAFTISDALAIILDLFLDPFDAILVSTAINENMDAIISRDDKLIRKASGLIPVLTPEEFLVRIS